MIEKFLSRNLERTKARNRIRGFFVVFDFRVFVIRIYRFRFLPKLSYNFVKNLFILIRDSSIFSSFTAKDVLINPSPHSPKASPGTTATFSENKSLSANSEEERQDLLIEGKAKKAPSGKRHSNPIEFKPETIRFLLFLYSSLISFQLSEDRAEIAALCDIIGGQSIVYC